MKKEHEGIRRATEAEAASLFELPEVGETAEKAAGLFRDADAASARSGSLRRECQQRWLRAGTMSQAEGGRLEKMEGNRLRARSMVEAALAESQNVEGEAAWFELAARYGLYVPHGRRLEMRAAEAAGQVYCYDVDEGEMAMHPEGQCPNGTLHHDRSVRMLRRRGPGGRLGPWPGRK